MGLNFQNFLLTPEGEQTFPVSFQQADSARMFISVVSADPPNYQNVRYFSPLGFFGYLQLHDEDSTMDVIPFVEVCQRVYSKEQDNLAAMEDRCRKYSCLAAKLDWIGQVLTFAFPPIAASLGGYPFSNDAANYGDDLFTDSPTSFSWVLEPNIVAQVSLVWNVLDVSPCNVLHSRLPAPDGCRQVGQRPGEPGACSSTPPQGGGGS